MTESPVYDAGPGLCLEEASVLKGTAKAAPYGFYGHACNFFLQA